MGKTSFSELIERLGLSDDEALAVFDVDPLAAIAGDVEARPELPILVALVDEAAAQVGEPVLRRWLRTAGPAGRPLDSLLARDFGAFETALQGLIERGLIVRRGAGN